MPWYIYSQVSMKRASLLNNCYYSGAPVALKTWCGHQFREGIIYPPGGDRVKVAAKTCPHIHMPTGAPAIKFNRL